MQMLFHLRPIQRCFALVTTSATCLGFITLFCQKTLGKPAALIRAQVRMPRLRPSNCDLHTGGDCQCYKRPVAVAQSLEELEYLKSACAAAQQGNLAKLSSILDKHPHAVNSDGAEGKLETLSSFCQRQVILTPTAGGSGYTPLHYAARGGHLEVAKLLLSKGKTHSTQPHAFAAQGRDKLTLQVQLSTNKPELVEPQPYIEHVTWDTTTLQSCCKLSTVSPSTK